MKVLGPVTSTEDTGELKKENAEVHRGHRFKVLSYCYYVISSAVWQVTQIYSLTTECHEANCFGVKDECQQVTQTWYLPSRAPGLYREKTLNRNFLKCLQILKMSSVPIGVIQFRPLVTQTRVKDASQMTHSKNRPGI